MYTMKEALTNVNWSTLPEMYIIVKGVHLMLYGPLDPAPCVLLKHKTMKGVNEHWYTAQLVPLIYPCKIWPSR